MAKIAIDMGAVASIGGEFSSKASELEMMNSRAEAMIGQLHGVWAGNRANKFFGDWTQMQPSLKSAIQVLYAASRLLKAAAQDFEVTDGA